MNKYAIIDEAAGHLVNVVLWDGDTTKWQPPAGTRAELLANVDLASLPPKPEPEGDPITAEEAVSKYFSPYQIAALQRLEMALLQAAKPLGPQMAAAKQWLENVLLGWAIDPTAKPAAAYGVLPEGVTFESASAEAVSSLTTPV
jgi:hypothetical protein